MTMLKVILLFLCALALGVYVYDRNNSNEDETTVTSTLIKQAGLDDYVDFDVKNVNNKEKVDEKDKIEQNEIVDVPVREEKLNILQQENYVNKYDVLYEIRDGMDEIARILETEDDRFVRFQKYNQVKILLYVLLAQVANDPKEETPYNDLFDKISSLLAHDKSKPYGDCEYDPLPCLQKKLKQYTSAFEDYFNDNMF